MDAKAPNRLALWRLWLLGNGNAIGLAAVCLIILAIGAVAFPRFGPARFETGQITGFRAGDQTRSGQSLFASVAVAGGTASVNVTDAGRCVIGQEVNLARRTTILGPAYRLVGSCQTAIRQTPR